MNPYASQPDRDPELWRLAKRRARFKAQLYNFLWVNALLWSIWALTGRPARPVPWPAWITFFWGLGLLARAFDAYGGNRGSLAERE